MNTQELISEVTKVIEAPSCYEGLKVVAQNWLEAIKTGDAKEEGNVLIKAADDCLVPIDRLIEFVESPAAVDALGEELAKNLKVHAHELKEAGAEYCDCGACEGCKFILAHKDAF